MEPKTGSGIGNGRGSRVRRLYRVGDLPKRTANDATFNFTQRQNPYDLSSFVTPKGLLEETTDLANHTSQPYRLIRPRASHSLKTSCLTAAPQWNNRAWPQRT